MTDAASHAAELAAGDRFAFGVNWARFLEVLDERRIQEAETSLRTMLAVDTLAGLRFVDIGSGSGLFSLAARRLGAQVHSFDYDAQSVACTRELRRRYFNDDPDWVVEQGSVLDTGYLARLGNFDVVYSWGVLHHTGAMWQALANVAPLVTPGGRLFIAIYNDQGGASRRWWHLKRIYNKLPRLLRSPYMLLVMGPREGLFFLVQLVRGRPMAYLRQIRDYARGSRRGMNYWHDMVDWIGGYPFEVAKPEQVFSFYRDREFTLRQLSTSAGGTACNEYVFRRNRADDGD
ncbi:MAG: class I SAM-dependent methyltransferase [Rubrivivax sp.]|nr:class I SAM-dependent methyltransferase [Rubrivivax sp.]